MKSVLLSALAVVACEPSAASQEAQPESWERHALSGVSVEMPCSPAEIQTHLFPVGDNQIACLEDGTLFGLMLDPREFDETEKKVTGDATYVVTPVSVFEGQRAIYVSRTNDTLGEVERHLIIDMQNDGALWAIARIVPFADGSAKPANFDRFFGSIRI